jgi:hypothetical protein
VVTHNVTVEEMKAAKTAHNLMCGGGITSRTRLNYKSWMGQVVRYAIGEYGHIEVGADCTLLWMLKRGLYTVDANHLVNAGGIADPVKGAM